MRTVGSLEEAITALIKRNTLERSRNGHYASTHTATLAELKKR